MKIKTIEANNAEEIDKLCNEFEEQHEVRATQTHIFLDKEGDLKYKYVLFHNGERK